MNRTQPINEMQVLVSATRQIATGDFSTRFGPPYHSGKLGPITRAFDDMAEALQRRQSEAKQAEERIRAALAEKEAILKEIHHRVKNNLQLISSLLNLQAGYAKERGSIELFRDLQARVRAMAFIHQQLYRATDLTRIDFAQYLRDMTPSLLRAYAVNPDKIVISIDVDHFLLEIDKAIPSGLIANELISNSLKHAFPEGREGEVHIDLRSAGGEKLALTVRDNGIGFPSNGDFRNTDSLGLRLVNDLTHQLGGEIELYRNGGTEFKVTFPA